MNKVTVSVIIPTYNRSDSINRAVDSVLSQTLKDIEVIVVDDNGLNTESGKSTKKMMDKYADNDKVIYIQHNKNKNGSAARNTGIRRSRGKYISFLDDDDIYLPSRLEEMVATMEVLEEDWGACYTGYTKHMSGNNLQTSAEKSEGLLFKQALMRSLYIGSGSNLFFRKSVVEDIGLFDESFKRNQDLEYLIRVLEKYKMKYLDKNLLEIFYDVNRPTITFEETKLREKNFRDIFGKKMKYLNNKEKKEVYIMWDLDWIRTLISRKKILNSIEYMFNSKIPLRIYKDYIKYAIDRKKNKTCYGFIVNL